jgi:hypothetical protein
MAVEMAKANRADLLVLHGRRGDGQKQLGRLVATARAAGVRASGVLRDTGVPMPGHRIPKLDRVIRPSVRLPWPG